ncbi:MAG: hypothetical protein AAGK32_12300 [Actinomycetota bacterium]
MLGGAVDADGDATVPADGRDLGFTVAGAIWVMAVTLVLVTGFANLFVQRYAQAVIRQATDEGARAWAVNGGTVDDCTAAANDVLGDLLGGPMTSGVTISCRDVGATIEVTAVATLAGLPPMPDANFSTTSVVTKELEDDLELP